METFLSLLLTWRLPVALLFVFLAVLPVRSAYRQLRLGDIQQKGAVEEVFLSSLLSAIAGAFYPFFAVAVIGVWIAFFRRRLLSGKAFLASLIAILTVALHAFIIHYLFV